MGEQNARLVFVKEEKDRDRDRETDKETERQRQRSIERVFLSCVLFCDEIGVLKHLTSSFSSEGENYE